MVGMPGERGSLRGPTAGRVATGATSPELTARPLRPGELLDAMSGSDDRCDPHLANDAAVTMARIRSRARRAPSVNTLALSR